MDREKFFNLVFYHLCNISRALANGQKYVAELISTQIVGIFYTALKGKYVFCKDDEKQIFLKAVRIDV